MDQEKRTPNKNKHVKWDEDKLKQTQKFRGTFQKISEPKTPYRGNSDEQMEQIEGEHKTQQEIEVDESLKQAQKNRQNNRHGKVDLAALNAKLKQQMSKFKQQDDEEMQPQQQQQESAQQKKKHEQFKKLRAAHYNQFKMIQQARNNKWEDDDSDD